MRKEKVTIHFISMDDLKLLQVPLVKGAHKIFQEYLASHNVKIKSWMESSNDNGMIMTMIMECYYMALSHEDWELQNSGI